MMNVKIFPVPSDPPPSGSPAPLACLGGRSTWGQDRGAGLLGLVVLLLGAGCGEEALDEEEAPTPMAMPLPEPEPEPPPEPECRENANCGGDLPVCEATLGVCVPPPLGGALGWGDGRPESVTFETIFSPTRPEQAEATDLEFSSVRPNELWVLHRHALTEDPMCNDPQPFLQQGDQAGARAATAGCGLLEGSTTTIFDPGTDQQREEWIQDFNAWHFMRRPSALAFGVDQLFATCADAPTANYLNSGGDFVGPSLWTSDPEIYRNWSRSEYQNLMLADGTGNWNGTHMDMLHSTPLCGGIAHESANIYWLVNGQLGALDRYDFNEHHGPGHYDHTDGDIRRYAEGSITRVPGVPSHLAFYEGRVYAADPGAGRVVVFDPAGSRRVSGIPNQPRYDGLRPDAHGVYEGGTLTELVAPGLVLQRPSGLEIHDGLVYVSDASTSQIHAFQLDGSLVRSLDTGLPPGSLAGLALSPEGQLYFVDLPNGAVVRVVPR